MMHWSAGPHLFVDDHQIWVFTALTMAGVHSPAWNKLSLGIEMLGDYDGELFSSGRGLQVRQNAVAAMATLCAVLGLDPSNPSMIRLHKEDPLTTHKFCPGKNVVKQDILQEVSDLLIARHGGEHTVAGAGGAPAPPAGDADATNPPAGQRAGRRCVGFTSRHLPRALFLVAEGTGGTAHLVRPHTAS